MAKSCRDLIDMPGDAYGHLKSRQWMESEIDAGNRIAVVDELMISFKNQFDI